MQENTFIALIPAYKPENTLVDLSCQLRNMGFSVVIVNDGSGADFTHIFAMCSQYAKVLTHVENCGKGQALKNGLSFIHSQYSEDTIIVTVDADGQHRPEDALAICKIADNNRKALVLGSRGLKDNVPVRSRIGNTLTRFVYKVSTGVSVHDTQTGLRAFSHTPISKMLTVPGERYEYEMNVLLRFARENVSIIEHEIDTIYLNNNASSHFDTIKDSIRIYKEILKFSAASFVGFIVDYVMYSLLLLWGCGLTFSNIMARVISASVIFMLNRKLVFKSKENLLYSVLKYVILAAFILLGNTVILNFLVNSVGVHQMPAKIITESVLFLFSWLIQKVFVFKKRGTGQ